MPLYENVFIARQDVSATQVDSLADKFSDLIKENGGEVTKKELWGLRNLSFRIKKNRKGHYVLLNIDAPSEAVLEMERNMRLSEDVMRYLTIRVKELETDQSVVLRSKGGRDERGRGGRRFGGPDRDRGGPRGDRREHEPRARVDATDKPSDTDKPPAADKPSDTAEAPVAADDKTGGET